MNVKGSQLAVRCRRSCDRTLRAFQQRSLSLTSARFWQKYENERHYEPGEDFLARTWHGLTYDWRRWTRRYQEARRDAFERRHPIAHMKRSVLNYELLPYHTEFLIIGGGLSGSSTAFWLKQRFRDEDLTVTVVEDTDKFANSRSILSTGELTQQFTVPEFVEMAMYGAEFMRHADNDPPDCNFFPVGFMHMARTSEDAEKLRDAWKMQISKGVKVAFYSVEEARQRFPFINFDDVCAVTYGKLFALYCLRLENEGFFDPWQLLSALREKNITLGVHYFKGEVEGFRYQFDSREPTPYGRKEDPDDFAIKNRKINGAIIRPKMVGASARPVNTYQIINCAGPWAGDVCRLAGIGKGTGVLSVPVPIHRRKRTYFVVHAPDVPSVQMPAIRDPSGVFCRPYEPGFTFICGRVPTKEEDARVDHTNMNVDYDEFYNDVWPQLVKRVPSFKNAKVMNAWAAEEDVNTFDDAPILGEHLLYRNLYTMSGFSNYGAQLSLAAGRLYAERAYDCAYSTVNVRRFDMRRIMLGNREMESLKLMVTLKVIKSHKNNSNEMPSNEHKDAERLQLWICGYDKRPEIRVNEVWNFFSCWFLQSTTNGNEIPMLERSSSRAVHQVTCFFYVDHVDKHDEVHHEKLKQLSVKYGIKTQHIRFASIRRNDATIQKVMDQAYIKCIGKQPPNHAIPCNEFYSTRLM
ncbi:putative fad oxidoreductase [Aphelenchoides besseyi]|nr:putative fad oxidoreductase [Aphelenchoides besseyi]